jgi:hypothetical protein
MTAQAGVDAPAPALYLVERGAARDGYVGHCKVSDAPAKPPRNAAWRALRR